MSEDRSCNLLCGPTELLYAEQVGIMYNKKQSAS